MDLWDDIAQKDLDDGLTEEEKELEAAFWHEGRLSSDQFSWIGKKVARLWPIALRPDPSDVMSLSRNQARAYLNELVALQMARREHASRMWWHCALVMVCLFLVHGFDGWAGLIVAAALLLSDAWQMFFEDRKKVRDPLDFYYRCTREEAKKEDDQAQKQDNQPKQEP